MLVTIDFRSRQKYRRTKSGKVASRKWITQGSPRLPFR